MKVTTSVIVYPLKSGKGICQNVSKLLNTGFEYDRVVALINEENEVLTAREDSKLLNIDCEIKSKHIIFKVNQDSIDCDLNDIVEKTEVFLFGKNMEAYVLSPEINEWFSNYLNHSVRLVTFKPHQETSTFERSFVDEGAIHLVNESSISDLNNRLKNKSLIKDFRPNIVVSGFEAYEEDQWKKIKIGNQLFEVVSKCPRCSMTSIVSEGRIKKGELLKELAKYKRVENKVYFGIYLKPLNYSSIEEGDMVQILE